MTDQQIEQGRKKWKTRRSIALLSFYAILFTLIFILSGRVSIGDELLSVVRLIIGSLTTIVLAYQGLATFSDIGTEYNERKKGENSSGNEG